MSGVTKFRTKHDRKTPARIDQYAEETAERIKSKSNKETVRDLFASEIRSLTSFDLKLLRVSAG